MLARVRRRLPGIGPGTVAAGVRGAAELMKLAGYSLGIRSPICSLSDVEGRMNVVRWIACIPAGFATWLVVGIALDIFMYVSTLLAAGRGADPWWWTKLMVGGLSAYCGTYAAAIVAPAGKPAIAGAMAGLFGAFAALTVVLTAMMPSGQRDVYLVVVAASTVAGAVGSVVAVVHTYVEHDAGRTRDSA